MLRTHPLPQVVLTVSKFPTIPLDELIQRLLVPPRGLERVLKAARMIRGRFFFKSGSTVVSLASRVSQAVVSRLIAQVIKTIFIGLRTKIGGRMKPTSRAPRKKGIFRFAILLIAAAAILGAIVLRPFDTGKA